MKEGGKTSSSPPLFFRGGIVLDLAAGTADICLEIAKSFPFLSLRLTAWDMTFSTLEKGKRKSVDHGILSSLSWCCGNAESLPFQDRSIDIFTMTFGLRNVTDKRQALTEVLRVLKPGGSSFAWNLVFRLMR